MLSTEHRAAARGSVIAVIGAGASGTLAVIHLLREAAARRVPLRVALIDRHGRHGLGQAYSTAHPAHLLNSPADAMSAVAGDPGHLTRWAARTGLQHDGFLPRHALLPRPHRWPRPAAPDRPVIRSTAGPLRLATLIRDVRASAADYAGDWQDIVDALRPQVPRLWEQLPEADQRAFLRLAARYWEVHRHRAPPATARRADALRSAGRLSVLRGRVTEADAEPQGVRVRIEAGGSSTSLPAGWLINCTGPGGDITVTADPLLRHLLDAGLARPDPLRLGLDADARGAVRDAAGRPADDIFTLGPPLRGRWYETTAIPEIRDQAAALARLLVTSPALAGSGSAA